VFYGRKFSEYHLILYEQAKINTKHTLHDLAGRTLKSIGKAVEDSTPMKLLLATALVHVGGINFDARSNMKIVQTLLSELDSASMCIFVDNVVREFVHPAAPVVDDAQIQENNAENLEAHSLAAFKLSQQENNRISSLECLFALAKNQSLACSHTYVLPMLCSLLCVVSVWHRTRLKLGCVSEQLELALVCAVQLVLHYVQYLSSVGPCFTRTV
jgi:hypothetical protein